MNVGSWFNRERNAQLHAEFGEVGDAVADLGTGLEAAKPFTLDETEVEANHERVLQVVEDLQNMLEEEPIRALPPVRYAKVVTLANQAIARLEAIDKADRIRHQVSGGRESAPGGASDSAPAKGTEPLRPWSLDESTDDGEIIFSSETSLDSSTSILEGTLAADAEMALLQSEAEEGAAATAPSLPSSLEGYVDTGTVAHTEFPVLSETSEYPNLEPEAYLLAPINGADLSDLPQSEEEARELLAPTPSGTAVIHVADGMLGKVMKIGGDVRRAELNLDGSGKMVETYHYDTETGGSIDEFGNLDPEKGSVPSFPSCTVVMRAEGMYELGTVVGGAFEASGILRSSKALSLMLLGGKIYPSYKDAFDVLERLSRGLARTAGESTHGKRPTTVINYCTADGQLRKLMLEPTSDDLTEFNVVVGCDTRDAAMIEQRKKRAAVNTPFDPSPVVGIAFAYKAEGGEHAGEYRVLGRPDSPPRSERASPTRSVARRASEDGLPDSGYSDATDSSVSYGSDGSVSYGSDGYDSDIPKSDGD